MNRRTNMSRRLSATLQCVILCLIFWNFPALAQRAAKAYFIPNRYTVILEDPPVSERFLTLEAMRAAPAVAYRQQIEQKQAAVVAALQARNITVTGTESTLLNAIFVTVTPDRLAELESIPGVLGVRQMRRFRPTLNKAVQLMDAQGAWNLLGGQSNGGKGMKIAILDTGIDQTHAAFQDSSLTVPAGFPKCTTGHPEDCAYTNNKVIVARSYVRLLTGFTSKDPVNLPYDTSVAPDPTTSVPDDYSPRDRYGHGTAVASAAAGNTNTGTVTYSGMAPKAFLGNYRISGSPAVTDSADDQTLIAALSDAVADQMDVVSLSSGSPALYGALDTGTVCGQPKGVPCDDVAYAYEKAAEAGMIIVVAAGNSGDDTYFYTTGVYPNFNSIWSPANAPSVIGVGASTNSHVMTPSVSVNSGSAPSTLKGIVAELSDATFSPSQYGANSAPLVDVTTLGNDGYACTALPAYSLIGSYALIERGPIASPCAFATKASNAQLAGAIGVVFYMADSSALISPSGLTFTGPAVMISNSDGLALKSYIDANPHQAVTIDTAGIETDVNTYVTNNGLSPAGPNQLASYSSFGPTPDGAIKPDLVAVGGFDGSLAFSFGLYLASQSYDPTLAFDGSTLYSPNGYIAADGTSFATPIVAAAAAMVKQAHPSYTAAQVKSALVNNAAQTVTVDDVGDTVDVQWLGAGVLDAGAAAAATITAEPATISLGYVKSGVLPVSRAITITNHGTAAVTLAAAVAANSTFTGATLALDKSSITLAAGAAATLNVTLSGAVPAAGEYSGAVTLKATGISLRLPYMFIVSDNTAYNANAISGFAGGPPGSDGGPLAVFVTDQFGVPVVGSPVTFSISPRGSVTLKSVSGEPACSPASSTTTVTCSTDNYGIAWTEVFLGSTVGDVTINTTAAGTPFLNPLGASILSGPQVTASNGVVDAASFTSPVSPGSYITIFGTNLVDPANLTNASGDSETTAILPLSLDYDNVSFDVPSAGISVPGHLSFISPGQINLQIPWELQGQSSVQVKVISDLFSNVVTVPLAAYTPGFFQGNGIVAAINATQGNIVTANTPVHAGDVIELFANGLGPVSNQPASGSPAPSNPLAQTTTLPTVTIGGQPAKVSFSGLAPGFPALYQVNITVPSGVAAGTPAITIAIGGVTSKASTIPLK